MVSTNVMRHLRIVMPTIIDPRPGFAFPTSIDYETQATRIMAIKNNLDSINIFNCGHFPVMNG